MNRKLKAWAWFVVNIAVSRSPYTSRRVGALLAGMGLFGVALSGIPLMLYITNDVTPSEQDQSWAHSGAATLPENRCARVDAPVAAAYIVPGLDRRFGWSNVPPWVSIARDLLILPAMWMSLRVFRENSFGSATVKVTKDQRVICTGRYEVVRHPMYSSAAVYLIGLSLALGSYWGLVPAALLAIFCLILRLFDEERFIAKYMSGYTDYCARVSCRLMSGIF